MFARTVTLMVFVLIVMMFVLAPAGNADEKDGIQKYFNNTACKVKGNGRSSAKA